ncbi:putative leader peptide [Streptomyces sp. P6-2-1]
MAPEGREGRDRAALTPGGRGPGRAPASPACGERGPGGSRARPVPACPPHHTVHIPIRLRPFLGRRWTPPIPPCQASAMSSAGIALVSRRHVDLCRMSSAICRAR